jgi:CRISPR/Cas system type I-B associated protein Csh2 (Cas7 group RAMP superfamily)
MRLFTVASTALTLISVAQAFDHFPFPCRQTYTGKKRRSINFEKKNIYIKYELIAVDGDTCQSIASNQGISTEDLTKWTLKFEDNFSCDEIKAGNLVCIDVRCRV